MSRSDREHVPEQRELRRMGRSLDPTAQESVAQKVQTILVSDLSGEELNADGQTVHFGFLGADYEIDLSDEELDALAHTMQKYVDAGRRVGGRRSRPRSTTRRDPSQTRSIKAWLKPPSSPFRPSRPQRCTSRPQAHHLGSRSEPLSALTPTWCPWS